MTHQVLRIDSSARGAESNSNRITTYIWERLQAQGAEQISHHDLGSNPLPPMAAEDLVGVHGSSSEGRDSLRGHLALSEALIAEVKQADTLIIGAPLYNFGIPATLKQWVDYIARAGQTFRYTENGPQGLSGIRDAYVVVATGGTAVGSDWDHASAYLSTVLGFIGVENIHIVDAAGSKSAPEQVIERAQAQVDEIIAGRLAA